MKMKLVLPLVFMFVTLLMHAQTYTISGYIEDLETGEKLIGANVFEAENSTGTVTNTFGFYSLTLPEGEKDINFSYVGYQSYTKSISLNADQSLNISLSSSVDMEQIEIVAEKQRNVAEETTMSTVELPIAQIKRLPALLGEVDVLKALQLLPGVQSGGEGQSGLYVRGGSPDQNLILLDGVPVYNVSHLFGFFSVFNADAIKDVKLIKGGYPARYGGRLSSVLEINMKEGNTKEFKGTGSIGLIASKLTLEGPLGSEKTSFLISGRRTYIDQILRPFIQKQFEEDGNEGGTGYFFYDINAKVNHKFSDKDRLFLSYYGGSDQFFFNSKQQDGNFFENSLGWGNTTAALRWNHLWTPKMFSNATLTYSEYDLDTEVGVGTDFSEDILDEAFRLGYDSGIDDVAARIDFDYIPTPDHFIRFGVSGIRHKFRPGSFSLFNQGDGITFDTIIGQKSIVALEYDAYVEDDFHIGEKIKVNGGLHFSAFDVNDKFYASLQPRISARILLANDKSIKLSYASMRQYVNLLSAEGIGLPTDLWVPSTERLLPQDSWQVAAGYAFKLTSDLDLTIEGYYKEMSNLVSFKEGSGLFEVNDWQDRLEQGSGTSYGAEFFLQKKAGRLNGWIGYTLSWTDRQFENINSGEAYPFRYDRRNDVSIVVQYEISDRVNISGAWVYGTGNAVTLANSNYEAKFVNGNFNSSTIIEHYKQKNNYRMDGYHRLDLGINFTKQKNRHSRTWSFGAYNSYNRKNPFFIFIETDTEFNTTTGEQTTEQTLKQASIFPIIPYATYKFEF